MKGLQGVSGLFTVGFMHWMSIDCVRNKEGKNRRMWWSLGLIMVPFSLIALVVYFVTRYLARRKVDLPYAWEK